MSAMQAVTKGAAIYTTDLAASYSLLTPAQIANLAITQKLSEEDLKASLAASKLTDEQIKEVWAHYNAATAKTTEKVATDGLTFSVSNLTTALWANIKAIWSWMTTNPVGWCLLLAGALFAAKKAYDAFNVTTEEHIEKLQELRDEYDETESELQSAQKELDETAERIAELDGYDALTFTEQGELEELKKTNKELARQVELLRQRNKEQAEAVDESAQKTWDAMNNGNRWQNGNKITISQYDANGNFIGNLEDYVSDVEYAYWLMDQITKWNAEIESLPADATNKGALEKYRDDYVAELTRIRDNAAAIGLDEADAFVDQILSFLDPEYAWSQLSDSVTDAMATASNKLIELKKEMSEFEEGNVKLSIRPEVEIDGGYETVYSGWLNEFLGDGQEYAIHYTPILDDGSVMSDDEIASYLDALFEGAVNASDILERDKTENGGKGVILRVAARLDGLEDGDWFASENEWGQNLHLMQEEYYDLIRQMRDNDEFVAMIEALKSMGIISDDTAASLLYIAESIAVVRDAASDVAEATNIFAALADHLKTDVDLLNTAIENLKSGNIAAIFEEEALDDLLDAFPDLVDELEAYSKGLMTAEQLQDAFNEAAKDFKADELYDSIGDVADAAEDYGASSNKVKQAIQNLNKVIPGIINAFYDEETGLLKVDAATLESESSMYDLIDAALEANATINGINLQNAIKELEELRDAAVDAMLAFALAEGTSQPKRKEGLLLADKVAGDFDAQIDQLRAQYNSYYSELREIFDSAKTHYENTDGSSSSGDPWLDAFEAEYNKHKHLVNMEQETLSDFYAWLEQANKKYFEGREQYIDEYRKYTEEVFNGLRDLAEDAVSDAEHQISLLENQRDALTGTSFDTNSIKQAKNQQIIQMYKDLQDQVHATAESIRKSMRDAGWSEIEIENSGVLQDLETQWWGFADAIAEVKQQIVDDLLDIVTATSEAVDSIQDVYDALHDAADEFAANEGFISVDTFQSLVELGPQYMQYLRDENGLLVINEENINKVIAAKTQQLALDNAMAYVERLRLALQKGSIEDLNHLLYATVEATDATWGLVYANLALLDLTGDQYQAALHNINAIRSLADNAVKSIGVVGKSLSDTLSEMKSGLDDILQYVMDMIRSEIEQQIEALEDAKDAYAELIKLKKESMDATEKETEYQEEVAEKVKEIAKLQERINALSLDDSREAQAEKISLEEEMAELQKELANTQAEYSKDKQEESLDEMQEIYEKEKDEEIKILEDSISSEEKLYRLAIERIQTQWDTLYDQLISWNTQYGSVLNKEITSAWENCLAAAERYGSYVAALGQIDADIEAAGSTGTNLTVGASSDYNTEAAAAAAKATAVQNKISEMQANSAAWRSTSDSSAQKKLDERNVELASEISGLLGAQVSRKGDGVWYIGTGGDTLYDDWKKYIYHTGGIAGDVGTLKENELLAKLEDGEAIVSNKGKGVLFSLIDFAGKLTQKLNLAKLGDMKQHFGDVVPKLSQVTNNNSSPSIHFGDVYITGADRSTVEEHRRINREFTQEIVKQLGIRK